MQYSPKEVIRYCPECAHADLPESCLLPSFSHKGTCALLAWCCPNVRVKMNGIVSLFPCTPLDPFSTCLCSDLPCSVSPGGFTMHSIPWAPHPLPSRWVLPVPWQEVRRPEYQFPSLPPCWVLTQAVLVLLYAGPQLLSAPTPPPGTASALSFGKSLLLLPT